MFEELGGGCSCVIAIQVGFDNLSPARRWLLQFVVCFIDTLLFSWFFADSCKGLSNLCVKHIPESSCNNSFEFSHSFCMEVVRDPIQHDQTQQLSISEHTILHEQLPHFAAVLWPLENRDWSIWGVRKDHLSVFLKEQLRSHQTDGETTATGSTWFQSQTVRNKRTLNSFLSTHP